MITKAFLSPVFFLFLIFFADYPIKNPYYIPDKPNDTRIRVEIVVIDNLTDENVDHIQEVYFNNQKLRLNKTDYLGNRGRFYLQIKPGNYPIKWTVRSKTAWPSTETYRRQVTIPKTASLFYIRIKNNDLYSEVIQ